MSITLSSFVSSALAGAVGATGIQGASGATGIAGATGSGKSTLLDVILGITNPQEGEVFISGLSPTIAFSKYPGAISYVPQEPLAIKGSVKDNLAFGYQVNEIDEDRKSTRLNSSHVKRSRMPSSA